MLQVLHVRRAPSSLLVLSFGYLRLFVCLFFVSLSSTFHTFPRGPRKCRLRNAFIVLVSEKGSSLAVKCFPGAPFSSEFRLAHHRKSLDPRTVFGRMRKEMGVSNFAGRMERFNLLLPYRWTFFFFFFVEFAAGAMFCLCVL